MLPVHAEALYAALKSGHLSGVGPLTKRAEAELERLGLDRALLCTSGTHALEMAALLANIGPGDEVILPSYTFVSTANAFALRGATLRFADNDRYGNISLEEVERLAGPATKLVVAVHYAGASADMKTLSDWCATRGVWLVEDAAQAIGGTCHGQTLGTFGALAAFSFHETKNVSAGEGGALRVNTEAFKIRAEIIREKGTNRTQFFLGLADKYTWVDIGSSYVLSELNVAYLLPQLEAFATIQGKRGLIWRRYYEALLAPARAVGAEILETPEHNTPNFHMFAVVLRDADMRTRFIRFMREAGITTPFHYLPLHRSPYGRELASKAGLVIDELPQCERLANQLVRLPLYFNMTDDEQAHVVDRALSFFRNG